jgi:hypothetical protein
MQLGDFERLFRQIDAGDLRALQRHAFGQDAAAATDIDHALALQAAGQPGNPFRRNGLMSCSGLNSELVSHQRWASWLNLSSSA